MGMVGSRCAATSSKRPFWTRGQSYYGSSYLAGGANAFTATCERQTHHPPRSRNWQSPLVAVPQPPGVRQEWASRGEPFLPIFPLTRVPSFPLAHRLHGINVEGEQGPGLSALILKYQGAVYSTQEPFLNCSHKPTHPLMGKVKSYI